VASGVQIKVDRLSAGGPLSRIRQIQLPGKWGLDRAEFNCTLRASGGLDPDCVAVIYVERASGSTICGVPLEDAMIVKIPAGGAVTANVKPGLSYVGAVVPSAYWTEIQSLASDVIDDRASDGPKGVRLSAEHARAIAGRIGLIVDGFAAAAASPLQFQRPPAAFGEYLGLVAEACSVAAAPHAGIERSTGRLLRQAWTAQDFIHAHIREELPINRLCTAVGVSRRQLEYAFRTTFSVSPREFIQAVRLNEARRLLMTARASGLSVTQVAMDAGINHLGRFATNYRQLFGESPRDTLCRAV
jgi:AraC-like DNA-binding protein